MVPRPLATLLNILKWRRKKLKIVGAGEIEKEKKEKKTKITLCV